MNKRLLTGAVALMVACLAAPAVAQTAYNPATVCGSASKGRNLTVICEIWKEVLALNQRLDDIETAIGENEQAVSDFHAEVFQADGISDRINQILAATTAATVRRHLATFYSTGNNLRIQCPATDTRTGPCQIKEATKLCEQRGYKKFLAADFRRTGHANEWWASPLTCSD